MHNYLFPIFVEYFIRQFILEEIRYLREELRVYLAVSYIDDLILFHTRPLHRQC